MNTKFKNLEKSVILISIIIFGCVFLYYTIVNPVIPYDYDDWRYFGFFESDPIPRLGRWNITRILPEYLVPLSGYLAAFIIFPIVGDYLASASIALALLLALFLSTLFVVSYRLFRVLCESGATCTFVSTMMMILCFAIFKHSPAGNVHMFFADTYNLYFCYVLPNILNSIFVLILIRELVLHESLSIGSKLSLNTGILFIGIYFCIFSMLFSAGILLSFAVSVVIIRFFSAFIHKQKISQRLKAFFIDLVRNYNIVLIIIAGMGAAMVLELQSGRSNADWDSIYTGSLFSSAFVNRIILSAGGLIGQIKSINKYVFLIIAFITLAAIICYMRQKNRQNRIIGLALKCFIPLLFLAFFYAIVSAKAGIDRTGLIYCTYGMFFFLVLFISLTSLYLIEEVPFSRIFFPFISVIMIMIVLNSTSWPYFSFQTEEKAKITNQVISLIDEASESGHEAIVLYVPDNYPLPLWATSRLSHTLYFHNITPTKMTILDVKYSGNNSMYYVAE